MREKKQVKKWHWIVLAIIIFLALAVKAYGCYWPKTEIKIAGQTIEVVLADNVGHRTKGLTGKNNIGKYDGMLFVYPDLAQHAVTTKGVKFPLDIIWINGREIVDMAPKVMPSEESLPYFSRGESDLVLQLPAGFLERNQVKIGDIIEIKN